MTKETLKTIFITVLAIGILVAMSNQSALAGMLWDDDDFSTEQLATIKVNITEAIAKAQENQTGTVVKAKLEEEDGKLMYEVELFDNGKEKEVMVDAISGNVTTDKD